MLTSGNEAIRLCHVALKAAKGAGKPDKPTDVSARAIYQPEVQKCIGVVSLMLRTSFEKTPAVEPTQAAKSINSIVVDEEDGERVKVEVPEAFPTLSRTDFPHMDKDNYQQLIDTVTMYLKKIGTEALLSDTRCKDPLKVCVPFRVLSSWQTDFLSLEVDHAKLAQLQHNFKQSLALFNTILKAAVSASRSLTGHIETCRKAQQELLFECAHLGSLGL